MNYQNPILRGMYPDPSVCLVDGVYYLVNSTFEYFPGVPIFSSADLINWTQIGNCLTRPSQLPLEKTECSGGIFAPTLRYHNERFYMITTCCLEGFHFRNFFVTATDPAGPWSDPVVVEFMGIDPSLYWEDGRTYIQYAGRGEICQIEIDEVTGNILRGPEVLTTGCGGRDAEGPHLWKRNGWYYLMLAEGGTREGHMETLMRSQNLWGPFEPSPYNPVISNKDTSRQPIQCVGHADWVVGPDGTDYLVTLGTRHLKHQNLLGRETMLTPAYWTEDGWLRSRFGYMPSQWEGSLGEQQSTDGFVLPMTDDSLPMEMISPRTENRDCYAFRGGALLIHGNGTGLDEGHCACWGVRQPEFECKVQLILRPLVNTDFDEAGLVLRASDSCHMSLFATKREEKTAIVLRKQAADIISETVHFAQEAEEFTLTAIGSKERYSFFSGDTELGWTYTRHLTVECAGTPNTGVVCCFYAAGSASAEICDFRVQTDLKGEA